MSNRELCIAIINEIEEDKLANVATMLQNIRDMLDESLDDAYCLKLYEDYLQDPDPSKSESILLENLAKELGVELV